jgi:hypothetical protein
MIKATRRPSRLAAALLTLTFTAAAQQCEA